MKIKNIYWLLVSVLVIILDQITKKLISDHIVFKSSQEVLSFLNWVHVYNPGAAFSFMTGASPWFFVGLGSVVTLGIAFWLRQNPYEERLFSAALALVAGGAMGNVIDRFFRPGVLDFIDVHLCNVTSWTICHWPAFNVADMAICAGAIGLILDSILKFFHEYRYNRIRSK